ncbi:hypothetical protein WIV_gp106 [Wiseana iridescent virus]|uniref:C3H1-type domain-containing protein n=1 Tax=Wiseana iridescent virus TaxID=68347 RepID=G0T5D2_IRV9|nr:hypothetical protein WIV_gp106 [Wiseana iridescent virus]ADO00450.1 hypothetical protein [Wiseana iridescent virus]
MALKMSMSRGEDSIVGYNKKVANYTNTYESDEEDFEEEDFYNHYIPAEEDFDDGEYQPFVPEEEEQVKKQPSFTFKKIKPFLLNSPTKSAEKSPKTSPTKSPSWWDKKTIEDGSKRMVNGVLNYAALLPPPTPKPEVVPSPPQPKKKKGGKKGGKGLKTEGFQNPKPQAEKQQSVQKQVCEVVQKPTRFCLSIIKKSKCFHGAQCRFAHDYLDLKECNFGEKCKKISVVKTNPDGTLELINKNEVGCNFKHTKESKNSYLKRVPQQHTSPRK